MRFRFKSHLSGSLREIKQAIHPAKTMVRSIRAAENRSLFRNGILTAFILLAFWLVNSGTAFAGVTASLSGTVVDPSGAVIAGATVTVVNSETSFTQSTTTNTTGFYTFAALPPGTYNLTIRLAGFTTYQKTGIILNVNDAVTADASLKLGQNAEVVTVTSGELHVETSSTQLGEVIESKEMTAVPLNGRSYTDLLALQPGVANANSGIGGGSSTQNTFQSGGFQLPAVSGDSNAGNQSVNGMRESGNGYLMNGISVQEFAFSGTAVIPNLDSLAEFRIITNNFDAEYGNFAGGQVNVVTKSGTNAIHGDVFEFLRNTDFDAANYFDQGKRGPFQQNQFGGAAGGAIRKNKVFYFGDYQGNRNVVGVSTGHIAVPTSAERSGDFSAVASAMNGETVQGAAWANTLSSELGYTVSAGEPYYTTGCTSSITCVFPNAQIPQSAITPISSKILGMNVIPLGDGNGNFSTSASSQRLTDNKASGRVDADLGIGNLFGYYFVDQFSLNNPYPVATVPGFSATTAGRTQAVDIGDTKMLGANAVNEARIGFLRVKDNLNSPNSSQGTTLTSLGFNTNTASGGIYPLDATTEGIPEIDFENFNIGVPSRVLTLVEDTYQGSDNFSRLIGKHSIKLGAAYHFTEMSEILHNVENGYFQFNQSLETGIDFADFLLGAPGVFEQGQTPAGNTRSFYLGAFAQDSWHARSNLTLNYGVRWDVISPWWEKHNLIETLRLGEQSVVFPNSPKGWVFPGDPGIPRTIAPIRYNNIAPRLGLAYSPGTQNSFAKALFGKQNDTSIRLGYGLFYSAFEGGYDFSVIGDAPYGAFYSSQAPPSFVNPYQTRSTGAIVSSPFPYQFPPTNVSASNPDPNVPASTFGVIGTSPAFNPTNRVPYAEQYEFSIQRQFTPADLVTISYVGTQGHRLLATQEANPVNQQACLVLYNENPNNPSCGPNNEPTSLRGPFGANFGSEGYFSAIAKSAYNSAQVNYRHTGRSIQFLVGYTYGKSLDDSSAFGEQVNPFNPQLTRGLSSFDIPQNLVVSYSYKLPFARLAGPKSLTSGWQLSGITALSNGLPVYIYENDDRSLLGTDNSGPLPLGIDTPNFSGGSVAKMNPRSAGGNFFDTSKFSAETIGQLGTARRRFFNGPGMNNFNTALSKTTALGDHLNLDFRAEFFNVFNHTQFSSVSGNYNSPTFGQATGAQNPRIGQLALKLAF